MFLDCTNRSLNQHISNYIQQVLEWNEVPICMFFVPIQELWKGLSETQSICNTGCSLKISNFEKCCFVYMMIKSHLEWDNLWLWIRHQYERERDDSRGIYKCVESVGLSLKPPGLFWDSMFCQRPQLHSFELKFKDQFYWFPAMHFHIPWFLLPGGWKSRMVPIGSKRSE